MVPIEGCKLLGSISGTNSAEVSSLESRYERERKLPIRRQKVKTGVNPCEVTQA